MIWNYQAPEGTGDTHYSVMRGTQCNLEIKQGEEEGYKPMLYIKLTQAENPEKFRKSLEDAIKNPSEKYPGIELKKLEDSRWVLEIPNMIVKYYTTTEGMKKAME